jgi:hypothetical protein
MKTIIIAGITRSGMTATMQMLNAGGYDCAGEYPGFEPFPVNGIPWDKCQGKAVKAVDTHLQFPPKGKYKIILLKRNLEQQAKSIMFFLNSMGMNTGGSKYRKALIKTVKDDYKKIENWAKKHETLAVYFEQIIDQSHLTALKISKFVGGDLDPKKMSSVVIKRSSDFTGKFFELSMFNHPD